MTPWRRIARRAALVVLIAASSRGRASAGETEAAEAKLRAGAQAFRAGLYEVALDEFAAAYALRPSARVEFNLAETLLALKRDAEAADAFDAFLADGPGEPADFRGEALRQLAALSARTASVSLPCTATAREIAVDGRARALPHAAGRLRVAPGSHRITAARVDGGALFDDRVDVSRGEHVTLSVCAPPPLVAGLSAASPPPTVEGGRPWRTGSRVAIALGLVAAVAGAVLIAVAASRSGPPSSSLGNYPL